MSVVGVSNVFLTLQTLRLVGQGQRDLANLQEQLATGLKTSDLSQLSNTESRRLLDLRGSESTRNSYLEVLNIIEPRVKAQASILDNIQGLINQIQQSVNTAP